MITQENLMRYVHYDPETGIFTRIYSVKKKCIGKRIGTKSTPWGHMACIVDGAVYLLHRLAWVYCYGSILDDIFIDHIDGNPSNNRISNLRLCDHDLNMQNRRKAKSGSKTGVMGVYWHKNHKKYRASVMLKGKTISREFDTIEEASDFYIKQKRKTHPFCTI